MTKPKPYRRSSGGRRALLAVMLVLAACSPTVKLVPPKEPITINLNIKLDANIRLRIEEEAKEDVQSQPIF